MLRPGHNSLGRHGAIRKRIRAAAILSGVSKGYVVPGMDGTALDITALLIDRDNTLWIGTMKDSIYRVHNGKADHFRSATFVRTR